MKTRQYLLGKLKKALNLAVSKGTPEQVVLLAKEIERLGDIPELNELRLLKTAISELERRSELWDSALNVRQIVPQSTGRLGIQRMQS